MKPSAVGEEKKRRLSSMARSRKSSAASQETPPDAIEKTRADATAAATMPAPDTATSDDWTNQQMARLRALLRKLEQISRGPSDDSPVEASEPQAAVSSAPAPPTDPASQAAVDSDVPNATEILAHIAHRFQQDDRLLAKLPGFAVGPAADVAEPETEAGRRVSIPAGVIPLTAGGQPDTANSFSTTIVAIGPVFVGLQTQQLRLQPGARFVTGVEGVDALSRYAILECAKNCPTSDGNILLAQAVAPAHDLFRPANLLPALDPANSRYEMRLSSRALASWVELGVLRPRLLDRVAVCPRCFALPTIRSACEHCGAVEFHSERLMHHFACAFVGGLEDFEQEDELVCPKCRMRALVAGTDFEYLDGPYQCGQCQASSHDLALLCQCLQCDHRYSLTEGIEQDLVGYDVDRLDLLAFVDNA